MSNARFSFHKEVIGWLGPLQRGKKNFLTCFRGVFENHQKTSKIPCFFENLYFLKTVCKKTYVFLQIIAIKFFHDEFIKREFGIL